MFNVNQLKSFVNANGEKVYLFDESVELPDWWFKRNFKNYAGYAALAMFEHTAIVIRETDKAVLVNFNVDINNTYIDRNVWIAKSIIKVIKAK